MAKTIRYLIGITVGIAAVVILLITAFEAAMYSDFGYYEKEYKKYDVLTDLDMEMNDVMYVTEEMMAYLRGERDELSVITIIEGEEQDFFNEQDRFHMGEVQGLFLGGLKLRLGAFIILGISLTVLFFMKEERLKALCRGYQIVLGVLAVMITMLGIWVVRDFSAVFTKFHEIFFDNDLWLFDPAEDYMIRMLPEGLFYDFVIRIGLLFVAGILVLLVLSIAVPRLFIRSNQRDYLINITYE